MQKESHPRSPGLASIQAKLLIEYAQAKGIVISSLVDGAGLTLHELESQSIAITPEQEIKLIENLIGHCDVCPFAMGYAIGFKNGLRSLGVIGHAMLASSTALKAIGVAARYLSNAYHFISYDTTLTDTTFKVILNVDQSLSERVQTFVLARDLGIISMVHKNVLHITRDKVLEFCCTLPRLPGMEAFERDFASSYRFGETANFFVADIANLYMPMPMGNRAISRILEQQWLDSLEVAALDEPVDQRVLRLLTNSPMLSACKKQVASKLNISERTLGRKLSECGTSWSAILSQVRLEKAMALLERTDLDVGTVAELVGYANSTVLSRKLIERIGCSAIEYRNSFSV